MIILDKPVSSDYVPYIWADITESMIQESNKEAHMAIPNLEVDA